MFHASASFEWYGTWGSFGALLAQVVCLLCGLCTVCHKLISFQGMDAVPNVSQCFISLLKKKKLKLSTFIQITTSFIDTRVLGSQVQVTPEIVLISCLTVAYQWILVCLPVFTRPTACCVPSKHHVDFRERSIFSHRLLWNSFCMEWGYNGWLFPRLPHNGVCLECSGCSLMSHMHSVRFPWKCCLWWKPCCWH